MDEQMETPELSKSINSSPSDDLKTEGIRLT